MCLKSTLGSSQILCNVYNTTVKKWFLCALVRKSSCILNSIDVDVVDNIVRNNMFYVHSYIVGYNYYHCSLIIGINNYSYNAVFRLFRTKQCVKLGAI